MARWPSAAYCSCHGAPRFQGSAASTWAGVNARVPSTVTGPAVSRGPSSSGITTRARVRSSELRSGYGGTAQVLLIDAPAEGGLSGGTVVDADTGDVVGLVAARDPSTGDVVAYPLHEVLGRSTVPTPGC